MSPRSRLLLAATLLAAPAPALAGDSMTLAVGGSGIGVEPVAGVRLHPLLGGHGNASLMGISHHFQSGATQDVDYLKLRSASAMLDLFPAGGGFRVSLGARYEVAQQAAALISGTLHDPRRWTSMGPVATIGWTKRLARGLVAVVEAGAMLRRDAPAALAAPNPGPIFNAQLGWRF